MEILGTERLYLRHWLPEDCDRVKQLATDPRVLQFIGAGEPWSDEKVRRFVEGGIEVEKRRGWILWPVIHRADRVLIGFCGFADDFAPDVEIGWWFLPEYWGQGLACEAARAVMQYGFDTFHFQRVVSVAQAANRRSIRLMEKLGMQFERSFVRNGIDVVCYARVNPDRVDGL